MPEEPKAEILHEELGEAAPLAPGASGISMSAAPALTKAPELVKRSMPLAISIALGIVLAAFLIWFFYELTWFVLLLYLSMVLATIVEAPVSYLRSKGVPRTLATVLILGAGLLLLGLLVYLLVISLNAQMGALSGEMKLVPARINAWVNSVRRHFPGIGEAFKDFNVAETAGNMLPSAGAVWTRISAGFEVVTYLVVTFFTVMYMVIEGPGHLKAARRLLPKSARLEATRVFAVMAKTHRGWFLASVGNVASAAVLTSVGLWIVGIPGAIVLGVIAGLGELIPTVGPALFALPSILIALVVRPELIVWVIVMFAIVQTIQSYTISPQVMKVGVELPVLVTIVSVLVMGVLFGLLGVLVAIPLVADLVVIWNYVSTMLDKDVGDNDQSNSGPDAARLAAAPDSHAPAPGRRRSLFHRFRKVAAPPAGPL